MCYNCQSLNKTTMQTIEKKVKFALIAQAHHLKPVVIIGQDGLSPNVIAEIEPHLKAHSLIKIKFLNSENKTDIDQIIKNKLNAEVVKIIGNIAIIYRPNIAINKSAPKKYTGPKQVKVRKTTRGTKRNPLKIVTVLGNQRITSGGLVKKQKKRQISKKKLEL